MRLLETSAPVTATPPSKVGPKPWGLPAVLLGLGVPVLLWASSLAASGVMETPDDLSQGQVVASLIFTIFLGFILIGLAAGFSLWRYRLGWEALGLRPFDRSFWWWPIVAAGAAHAAIIAYSVVLIVLGAEAAAPEQEDLDELFRSRAVLPLTGVATVLVAPVAEEIFFRGFVFAGLLRRLGVFGAMAASGFLFGAFHITSAETVGLVLPFGVIGMLFAWLYYRTGSLWTNIATHLLFNLVSFIALALLAGSVLA